MTINLSAFEVGGALHAMTKHNQWALFQKLGWNEKKQKWDKRPITPAGGDLAWKKYGNSLLTYEQMKAALVGHSDRYPGFLFTEKDDFFCLDIDNCFDRTTRQWSPTALDLLGMLPDAVVEVSMSEGLHAFGSMLDMPHICFNKDIHAEFYTKDRLVALTGNVSESPNRIELDQTFAASRLVEKFFERKIIEVSSREKTASIEDLEKAAAAIPFVEEQLSYDDWLACCMGLHQAGVWACEEERAWELAQQLTEQSPKYIPGYLEFKWHSFDADREHAAGLGTLFHHAKLGGYKTREEIAAAEAFADYESTLEPVPAAIVPAVPMPPTNVTEIVPLRAEQRKTGILYPDAYIHEFGRMIYITSLHSIWVPNGEIYDQKRFDMVYGGVAYSLDMEGRKLVDSAWEAFKNCRCFKFPHVRNSCFRPDLAPGTVINRQGKLRVNVYMPVKVPRRAGNVEPFLTHLAKVLPDERDRRILLSYMAAVVQYPGVKFQWAPLLQGVEGNGKTFFTHCVEQAVGEDYTHYPQAHDLDNKFNAWMPGKILIAVEDVYVPGHKANVIEVLKPMITGSRSPIQGKGADQVTMDICANFMFNSNYKDALGAAIKGRRYCIFYSAQQHEDDIARAGMTGNYFKNLYDWAKREGFAYITEFLHNYEIAAEFNPAGDCTRAPRTSSHTEAISESQGPVEQEVQAAIAEERPGFVAPWISSLAVDALLRATRKEDRVPRNKRRALIESLGYVRHPGLHDGRTNNIVAPDAGRTTLYCKIGHPALQLEGAVLIAERYSKTQLPNGLEVKDAEAAFRN